ncbi:cell division protein FtsA [Candidatus Curtissbacteria bacterium RIFCSPHIGHO2_01_FULL_41_44]|uniref:Cell division protein FtsA n=1 Tax=Candidatus Curtissbacteria bacterium RIFCSPLOWO2_01_FULL_42_50 TaxID=1797730 RepID=A0A1F5H356_9BACT|nr:MAG: cell division protein FtsA [Candidatus Curtissbacteria bacterium RIFCSPHIGHO2_02_FULL_42_58]OGD94557.1 MAG: cell division protein FtsA [Candidatus Curtissbacteria bacterium RIFCSPHIGHO2_01_FULL_41_44]OGD97941.1 MAG: cell division protein FtsA [Candidatus Curtissbacteria bacterium RIFCSPHIGHO2_12_FULL_42_33]OGD98590.1 MAG: cell division protein FtsA [Candidatus Curtissbacteria bacterium RIFCSPLOWO2_01_FULL_42_50]OGE11193.1 MAG: cell division protein FtsA [Candidatus Curtissbacteria bacte
MSKDKVVVGVDIGSSKITTVITTVQNDSSVNVIGVSTLAARGLRKGQVVDIEEAVAAISQSLEAAERMAGYSVGTAFISVDGVHIESQNSKGVVAIADASGEITTEDVTRVIEAARAISLPSSREILHVIPRYFVVDSQSGIKDPLGMTGVRMEVETHIITGATTALRNIAKCASLVGIDVEGMVFSGLASSYSTLSDTERELGVILVDFGGGTTDICIFTEGSPIYCSVIPVGARNVTNDLAIGLRISLESAEKIKLALSKPPKIAVESGENGPVHKEDSDHLDIAALAIEEDLTRVSKKTLIDGIMKPRLREILNMVKIEIQKSGLGGLTPSGVVLTGGGAETSGMIELARHELGMPVRIGIPQGATGLIDEISSPAFASSLGLVIYGAQFQQEDIRLPLVGRIQVKGIFNKGLGWIKSLLP